MPEFLIHVPGKAPCSLSRSRPEIRIGRAPDQDIVLADPAISRKHARIVWKSGSAFLEDFGSRHGCFLNGTRIESSCRIRPGDEIRLGLILLNIESIEASPPVINPLAAKEATVTLALPVERLRGWGDEAASLQGLPAGTGPIDILHRLSLDMVGQRAPKNLLTDLLDNIFRLLHASRGAVFLRDATDSLELLATRSMEDTLDPAIRLSEDTLEALFERREALLLDAGPRSAGSHAEPGDESTTHSVMAVPLESHGEVLGLFYFDVSMIRGSFTANEIRFVASLSNLAAAKIIHQRTSEELARKADLERRLLALESTARAKGELLAFMSHEIRNPLSALLGFIKLAQLQNLPEAAQAHLRKADRAGRILVGILNDALDYSKLEAGRMELERIAFQLSEVLSAILDMHGPQAEAKGLRLRLDVAPGVRDDLQGDPLRLGQILMNLVGNATKFTVEGEVVLKVEPEMGAGGRELLRFSVSDTGIGISPEQMPLLFEPFAQAEGATTARKFGGTGLGLFISRRLVEMLGGRLVVESELGKGSAFSFSLDLQPAFASATAPFFPGKLLRPPVRRTSGLSASQEPQDGGQPSPPESLP